MIHRFESLLFKRRAFILALFALVSVGLGWGSSGLRPDASFDKMLPADHPFISTFHTTEDKFGGSNVVLVALEATHGDIFTKDFFDALRGATDEIFFLPSVDRARVSSLFTPNTRFTEIVENGFAGGPVVPVDFQPTPEFFATVRLNIRKAGLLGRLVSDDYTSAAVAVKLLEGGPGVARPDYIAFGHLLETKIRDKFQTQDIHVHIIGFAKAVSDIADGAQKVVLFFALSLALAGLLLYAVSRNVWLTAAPMVCSVLAVVWQLGLLTLFGYGIDPLSILIPFLVMAIGLSHGVQMVLSTGRLMVEGADGRTAAQLSFRALFEPGATALVTAVVTFLAVLTIPIPVVRELAFTAALGIASLAVTNLVCLPLMISYVRRRPRASGTSAAAAVADRFWHALARMVQPRWAVLIGLIAAVVTGAAWVEGRKLVVGESGTGIPQLWDSSRYNQDAAYFSRAFAIGVDQLQVLAVGPEDGCSRHDLTERIDDLDYRLQSVPGVRSTLFITGVMKMINAGWNEGNIKTQALPRDPRLLARSAFPIEPATGLLNRGCTLMPLTIFLTDHRAATIERVVEAVQGFQASQPNQDVQFLLAAGNAGVMAATNQVVASAELPMLGLVYGAVIIICLVVFRSVRATLCIVLPLAAVSIGTNAVMVWLGIGLTVSTLPVTALGVGIGVDYGIYKFSRLSLYMRQGRTLQQAYLQTLRETGSAVIFTGLTLSLGVATWALSPLKFQADMGLLLTFMFMMNMAGAIVLLPAVIGLLDIVLPRRAVSVAAE